MVGSNEKNLSKFPKKSKIGDWYKLDSDMNISKIMDSSKKGAASMGDRNGVKSDGTTAKGDRNGVKGDRNGVK